MRKLGLLFLFTMIVPRATAAENLDLLFVLDASGSMRQVTGQQTQIDAARDAIRSTVKTLPPSVAVGLRVYAHRVEQSQKEDSCKDTELMVPIAKEHATRVQDALATIQPKGYTPTAYSLEQVRSDFNIERESKRVVILLSDGEETCGGDPAATISKLKADGIDVTVHVIGFNVDANAEKQLKAAALAGGGQYFEARNGAALANALAEATKSALVLDKQKSTYGTDIRGGDSFETAVPIETGKEFRLDHHQKKSQYDYFYVELNAGDEVQVQLKTLERGVSIGADGAIRESASPYAGASLHSSDRTRIAHNTIIGAKFGNANVKAASPTDGKLYILIGNDYDAQHKDHATFTVTKKSNGDADTNRDAGDSIATAMPIEVKRYQANHIGGPDKKDTFAFPAKKGERYQVGYIPGDDLATYIQIDVLDEYKAKIVSKTFATSQGGRTDWFTIPEDGTYYIQIYSNYTLTTVGQYAFELKKEE